VTPSTTGEGGAGSVLAVAIVGALICVTATVVPLYSVLSRKQALAGAADAAALAAADARVGILAGEPCDLARSIAAANGAGLDACRLDGLVVTVSVSATIAGFAVRASATAGPPHPDPRSAHR
jgi:secretion/DNA translocation related TadE-like protein